MESTVFSGARARWLPLYRQLYEAATAQLGPFDVHITRGDVLWRYASNFVQISPRTQHLRVSFSTPQAHDDWEPFATKVLTPTRVEHTFAITDASRFPFLLEEIAQVYARTQAGKERKPLPDAPVHETIDDYIRDAPEATQSILAQIRQTIRNAAPDAQERMSWQMPTFHQRENLVHFALASGHIGLYPGEEAIVVFSDALAAYSHSKGAVRFPLDAPIPYALIDEIVRWRVQQVQAKGCAHA